MKCAKIITIYLKNNRRMGTYNTPVGLDSLLDLFDYSIQMEKKIDPGVDCDTIIVNHGCENEDIYHKLWQLDGKQKNRGVFKIMDAPNIGFSFGGYSQGYEKFKDQYDYFFFCEDDVIFIRDNYFKTCIDQMKADPEIGFVAIPPIRDDGKWPAHCGGGVGCSSNEILSKIYNSIGKLPHIDNTKCPESKFDKYFSANRSEILFTSIFNNFGYKLKQVANFSMFPINYRDHECQNELRKKENIYKDTCKYIYQVGHHKMKTIIIVVYYNRPNLIRRTLESVKNQGDNWEMVFIDDGSEIPGRPIVEEILKDDLYRIKFMRSTRSPEEKIKIGSEHPQLMNKAILESNADVVVILCDDDMLYPEYVQKLNDFYKENPNVMFSYCDVKEYDPTKDKPIFDNVNICKGQHGSPHMTYRTECIKSGACKYPENKTWKLDREMYHQLLRRYGNPSYNGLVGQLYARWSGMIGYLGEAEAIKNQRDIDVLE